MLQKQLEAERDQKLMILLADFHILSSSLIFHTIASFEFPGLCMCAHNTQEDQLLDQCVQILLSCSERGDNVTVSLLTLCDPSACTVAVTWPTAARNNTMTSCEDSTYT